MREYLFRSWSVSWPMVFIMLFEFLIGLTDVFIAGKIGKEVQASVGFSTQVYFMFIVIANALTIGTVATVSRLFTSVKREGDADPLPPVIFSTTALSFIAGIILSISGFFLSPTITGILKVPGELRPFSSDLLRFYALGLPFHYLLINSNGILRAVKMVRKSLMTMSVVCLINILLNFTFVFYTGLRFRGIALSTALSVLAGSLINLYILRGFFTGPKRLSLETVKKVISIGWPSGFTQLNWQTSSTILFLILSRLPENAIEVMAAFTNGLRIESAIFLPAFAFNMSNAVMVGNLLGEEKRDEAVRCGRTTALLGTFIVVLLTLLVVLNAGRVSGLLSDNVRVIHECRWYIYISMISEPFMAWGVILGGGLAGAGDTRGIMKIILFSLWAVRIPLSFLLGIYLEMGQIFIWWSMNASILIQSLLLTRRFMSKRWLEVQ